MNIKGKNINIFGDTSKPLPVVYLHTVRGEGHAVWEQCQKIGTKQFVLVEIDGVNWNNDMSPWPLGKLFPEDEPCGGKAEEWLGILTQEIIPQVETQLHVTKRFIAGYSLAGLFAMWSVYYTYLFDGVISGSGSFWYPDFLDYVHEHEFKKKPESIYLSLGDKEHISKIELLTTIEDNTRSLYEYFQKSGINTIFELNNGNHFQQGAWRMAKGMKWSLKH
ncbi:alpha/beta hydrolase-fold protein [uncultured Bacteroides sp.]|uniref:alpha/beta hydrolase n=1 Tax=uncultured Bacteroides sp. TaxID=162156 RepID=UPI002AA90F31|nr:alpha/beta hydrolase-fold protein [uncultured Bacteroides sp.]